MLGEETTERFPRFDVLPKDVRRANYCKNEND